METDGAGVRPDFTSPLERAGAMLLRGLSFNKALQARFNFLQRIGLRNRDFTIISDNCWGGFVYQHFGLRYRTPFIGLFLFGPCYVRLLQDFERNMRSELTFIDAATSRYAKTLHEKDSINAYPVGVIGDGIELHFLHYATKAEAQRKWRERTARINPGNMLFKFSDLLVDDPDLIAQFAALPFRHKVCFTREPHPFDVVYCNVTLDFKKHLNSMKP